MFIETPLDDWGSAYRKLGDLLGLQDRCETLATYCDSAYKEVSEAVAKVPADCQPSAGNAVVRAAVLPGSVL